MLARNIERQIKIFWDMRSDEFEKLGYRLEKENYKTNSTALDDAGNGGIPYATAS